MAKGGRAKTAYWMGLLALILVVLVVVGVKYNDSIRTFLVLPALPAPVA